MAGPTGNMKRIAKELEECSNNVPGIQVSLPDDSDSKTWSVTIDGPLDSVYCGGKFHILLTLPPEYPFKPPTVTFKTKIYHPNVTNDDPSIICLGMLRSENWKPPNKIRQVLELVQNVMKEPMPDDAVEMTVARQYKEDKAEFEKTAKEWVERYAMKDLKE